MKRVRLMNDDQALGLNPDYDAYNESGKAKADAGDFAGAIEDYSSAAQCAGTDSKAAAHALYNVAEAKMYAQDWAGAVEDADRAAELLPEYPHPRAIGGYARYRQGDLQGGLKGLDRALELAPDHAISLAMRGEVKYALGELRDALADLDRSISVLPDRSVSLQTRSFIREALGNERGALDDLRSSIEHYRLGNLAEPWFGQLHHLVRARDPQGNKP